MTDDGNDLFPTLADIKAHEQKIEDWSRERLAAIAPPPKEPDMNSIEQAREARGQWRYEICYGPEGEENYAFVYDADGALVSNLKTHHAKAVVDAINSPATPVDGVEAVPWGTAWQTNYTDERWHFAREASFAAIDIERGIVKNITPLYAAPLANPEVEARLRERVAVPDFARSIADVVEEESASGAAAGWRSCSGCHETNEGYETGHYPYSPMFGCFVGSGCSECGGIGVVWECWDAASLEEMSRDTPPTEARLAQAEGGPAVTEAMVSAALNEGRRRRVWGTTSEFRAILDAALHPQSAAGEEGKP